MNKNVLKGDGTLLTIYPGAEYENRDVDFFLDEAINAADLSKVKVFRFDTVPLCNVVCNFCGVTKDSKYRSLNVEKLKIILERIAPSCQEIAVGCKYEPLMAKNFSEFGDVLAYYIKHKFAFKPVVYIVTNGMLLDKRNLNSYLKFLSYIYISVSSHKKEVLESIEKGADFERLEKNLKELRNRYKGHIKLEMVLGRQNMQDVMDYVQWSFQTVGADAVHIRRIDVDINYHPSSPLSQSVRQGIQLALTDDEWQKIVEEVSSNIESSLRVVNWETRVQWDKPPVPIIRIEKKIRQERAPERMFRRLLRNFADKRTLP